MRYYLAPMEGVTTYTYRNAYHELFHPMDSYMTPFIVPHKDCRFKARELKEILPEHNQGLPVVPQILTNRAEDFVRTGKQFVEEFGYREVNLNLGCPSGTVVAKKKGSGFLAYPDELDAFLYEIFAQADFEISIKTRIGKHEPEEMYELLDIYNKYPVKELAIHPRVQKEMYRGKPHRDYFGEALKISKNPICYNGDLFTAQDYVEFTNEFPEVEAVMLGRGIIRNPGLLSYICEGKRLEKTTLRKFHDILYTEYREVLYDERAVLFKMKEMWFYMAGLFADAERYMKKIKKADKLFKYDELIDKLFMEQDLVQMEVE